MSVTQPQPTQSPTRPALQPRTTPPPHPPSPPASRGGLQLVYVVFGLLLALWGVGWLLDELGVIELATGALLPVTLIGIGLVLLLDAGRHSHGGLIALGAVLTVSLAITSTVTDLGVDRNAGTGDRLVRPVIAAQLAESYEHAVGNLTIDLRSAPLTEDITTVTARVGIGQLVVQVPPGVPVQVRGRAAVGDVRAFGQNRSGVGVDATLTDHTTAGGYAEAPHSLRLDLRVGVGGIEVQR